ncbi:NACHT domain-containing protein [Kitasatospora sp. NPDC059646]|uniref:NACHT domain-containing protein n=1 Tax=Kitasatospora sp. NPDC059646 TaxID=3346893 RepID=UPI0036CCBC06
MHNEVRGGQQETVVQVGYLERLTVRVGIGFRGLLSLLGVVLLTAQPSLPLPRRLAVVGPVPAGWALLGAALLWELAGRVAAAWRRRREASWSSPAVLDRVADELAAVLLSRYRDDDRLRQADNPESIDVLWREVGGGRGAGAGAVEPPDSLAAYFRRTPGRRLVLLGPAGAGKSVLAVRLARDLLAERQAAGGGARGGAEPVPLVLHLASWNPGQGLDTWAADRLAAEYPELCTPVPGAVPEVVAGRLIGGGRVLPVLDGFDELPAASRGAAFAELAALHSTRPFVLTSRPDQYRRQVPVDSDFLRSEIVLLPLSSAAVGQYLSAGGRRTRWLGVVDRLVDPEDRTREVVLLRQALDVPLMAGLARVAYADGSHPDELVRPGRFRTVEEVQGHLYTAYLDAVYSSSRSERALRGGRSPEEARRWAGFLAGRMKATGRTDLSWWTFDRDVPAVVRVLGLLPAFLVAWLTVGRFDFGEPWWGDTVPVSVPGAFAIVAAVVLCLTALSVAREEPGWHRAPRSLELPGGDALRDALRAVRWKAGATALGVAAAWTAALASGSGTGLRAAGLATACGLVACLRWLLHHTWRPADTALADSPARLLARDRRAVLAVGWLGPLGTRDALDDPHLRQLVLPTVMVATWQLVHGPDRVTALDWALLGLGGLLCWQLHAVAVSAWGRFAVARCWLALSGRLPLRLLDFLEDAHRRGVLRQSGGVYQFRHVELRDRLAADAALPAEPDRPATGAGSVLRLAGRGAVAFVLFAAQLALVLGTQAAQPGPWPVTALPEPCALLDRRDLGLLATDHVQYAHPPASEGVAVVRACTAAEQAPFAPDMRATVTTVLFGTDQGPDRASRYVEGLRRYATTLRSSVRALDGLGDEAFLAVRELVPGPDDGPHVHLTDQGPRPVRATVAVRRGNAVLLVLYVEEFATDRRVSDVVRVLADHAVRRVGGRGWSRAGGDSPPGLDAVPRSPVPDSGNRFAYYHRDWRDTLHGASWSEQERSRVWHLGPLPFAFRGPRELDCANTASEEERKRGQLYVLTCGPAEAARALGVAGPEVRIELTALDCGGSCDDAEGAAVANHDRAAHPDPLDWQRVRPWVWYAERSDQEPSPGRGRYSLVLYRTVPWQRDGELHRILLWLRVETSSADQELAQKIVNSVYAQTYGDRADAG